LYASGYLPRTDQPVQPPEIGAWLGRLLASLSGVVGGVVAGQTVSPFVVPVILLRGHNRNNGHPYSPKLVEGKFSEVRMQHPA
jgi:hypothetical protein